MSIKCDEVIEKKKFAHFATWEYMLLICMHGKSPHTVKRNNQRLKEMQKDKRRIGKEQPGGFFFGFDPL